MSTHTPHRPAQLRRWTPAIGLAALVATATVADITVAAPATSRPASAAPAVISSHTATTPVVAPPQVASPARPAAAWTLDLCATTGTAVLPNANTSGSLTTSVPIWSYVSGDCTTGSGTATLGGAPTLVVSQGDSVAVTLHNDLAEASALTFKGQLLPSDTTGAASGGSTTYNFVASAPGTYMYQAGVAGVFERQVAMGLWGVLIVLPTAAGQAYDGANSAFDSAMTVTISEIDPALNLAPSTFDMRNYAPKFTLYNGEPYPGTGVMGTANAGDDLLVRYLNAGLGYHSLSVLGANQRIIAEDGNPLTYDYSVVAQTVGPGQTTDAIIAVPAATPDGGLLTLFDGALKLHNRNRRPVSSTSYRMYGGAVGFVQISGTPGGGDVVGPVTSGVAADGITGSVAANVSDVAQGASAIATAEYFIDSVGAVGSGTPMTAVDASFDTPTEAVQATIPAGILAGLGTGAHSVYVRGQDTAGNWGAVVAATISFDRTGPTTSAVVLLPASTNGSVNVAVRGTASDVGAGNSNVTAAEYWIDAGAPVAIAIPVPAATVSIDATITAATVNGLADGNHTVSVRSQDAAGNWGAAATATLKVDKTGPVTSAVVANPNPNNGSQPFSPSIQSVRVTATVIDAASNVVVAEAFIDSVGANGTGALAVPVDGSWNSSTENVRIDIPLSTVTLLASGPHTISVHGKDAAGNWGAVSTVVLDIDRTSPTIGAPSVVAGGPNAIVISTTAADAFGLSRVEFFIDIDPGRGSGVAMTAGVAPNWSSTLSTLAGTEGTHTMFVRARDNAGNWSVITSTTFTITRTVSFSTAGNSNPPGVGGTSDDSDIYQAIGSAFTRQVDLSTLGVATGANVDGLKKISNTDFYVSFSADTTITGLGAVQDEDIVRYNGGVWSVYFNGTAAGLNTAARDIDAFDIVGGTIYFSTAGNSNPPGVGGGSDDSDVYSWNGSVFARVWDATANGVAGGANVDGLNVLDATHFMLSFADNTTITGPGAVQDEDIVYFAAGGWMLWFDGTAKGLTNANLDLDAIDVP